jgi:hypothetical protein
MIVSLGCAAPVTRAEQRAKGGPVETGPGSTAAARKFLEGRWTLVSYDVYPPGGDPIRLAGSGTLEYDAFGNLNVEIRVDEPTARQLEAAGIPSEKGVVSMKGRTVIDVQSRTLTYVLEGQPPFGEPSSPWALNRSRHWEVAGNVLTLTTKATDGRPLSTGVWEKLQ